MSGLWSFRETGTLPPCLGNVARKLLPSASDNFACSGLTEGSAAPMLDPVNTFSMAADVDTAVQEVQNEWLERTVGHLTKSPYHLHPNNQEASQIVNQPTDGNFRSSGASNHLDADDLIVLKSLLQPQTTCAKKVRVQMKTRLRPTVPAPPVLHTAELASRRERRRSLGRPSETANAALGVQIENNSAGFKSTTKHIQSLHEDCGVQSTPDMVRSIPHSKSYSFVWHTERRAAERRKARSLLGVTRVYDTEVIEVLPSAQGVVSDEKMNTSRPFNGTFLLNVQAPPTSLERTMSVGGTGIDCLHSHEAVAHQWYCVQLKKAAWWRWSNVRRSRVRKLGVDAIPLVMCTTDGDYLFLPIETRLACEPLRHRSVVALGTHCMQLLRWYFVLWVATVEIARDTRAFLKRTGMAE